MHTTQQVHSHHHGSSGHRRGPEVFPGYCHESGRMRMMDYTDYVSNMRTGLSNMYQGPATMMQPMMDALNNIVPAFDSQSRFKHDDCCCHEHHCHHEPDCSCQCCIRCADLVEYARCGEVRQIPVTFENESRRERNVKLVLGAFATESGQESGWPAQVSETEFKLPPCGAKTVLLSVTIDCARIGVPRPGEERPTSVDSCKVLYATLRAEGCTIRPIVIAIAVLPEHCGAHHTGCSCGCCCN
jgi:hypothetical protein